MRLNYLGGLFGFVVGDTMGLPLVKISREELLKNPVTKMTNDGFYHVPLGTWGDATSLLLVGIESINEKEDVDYDDVMFKYNNLYKHGKYTVLGEVLKSNEHILNSLKKYEDKVPALSCGDDNPSDTFNLFRMIPLVYYAAIKKLNDHQIREIVVKYTSLLNVNEEILLGCYYFVRLALFLLNGKDKLSSYSMAKCVDYSMFKEETLNSYKRLLNDDIGKYQLNDIDSDNNFVHILECLTWLNLKSTSYKESVIGAINMGDETETIGALSGFLAGITYGYDFIPEEWKEKIARREYLQDIFEDFIEALN